MMLKIDKRVGSWVIALMLLALCAWADTARAQDSRGGRVCTECHKNVDVDREKALGHADSVTCLSCHHIGLSNDPQKVAAARLKVCKDCHNKVAPTHTRGKLDQPECSACHDIHTDAPLEKTRLPNSRCTGCHERPHVLHDGMEKAECTSCHKLHGGKPLRAIDTSVQKQCVSCHQDAHPAHEELSTRTPACTRCHSLGADAKLAAIPEGAALTRQCVGCHKNMVQPHKNIAPDKTKPECVDCHDFTKDPKLPAAEIAISQKCGSCHEPEMKEYRAGGHAKGMSPLTPNKDLPNCVSCHKAHDETHAAMPVRVSATQGCVKCHSNDDMAKKYDLPRYVGGSFTDDFHGATVQFAMKDKTGTPVANVMICSDCHGAHGVAWTGEKTVAEVCAGCHKESGIKLAGAWLGHSAPGPRSQPLIWLTRMFYYVLIPFVLGGLIILIAFQMIDQRRKGATVRKVWQKRFGRNAVKQPMVQRFSRRERSEHLLSALSFTLLCVTGLPQTAPSNTFAHWIIALFGGIESTRFIHRVAGFLFVGLFILHVGTAIMRAIRRRRMPVMVPSIQDFHDTAATIKHFLWNTPRPKTGKFDFSEKFEYWGMVMGGTLMCVTGVVLVWPDLVSQLVPGVFIAMFRTLHGLEATFAVMVVVLWHSYGVILRPEVFPIDTSIFTGKISVERLEEEHGLEYDKLIAEHPEFALPGHDAPQEEEKEAVGSA
jgi:predicted CXXCH cytochrome family protein